MRRSQWLVSFALVIFTMYFLACRGEQKTMTNTSPSTTTAISGTSTMATTPMPSGPLVVTVDMKLVGLCTIADASVANDPAKKTVILVNHKNHKASFIVHKDNLDSLSGFTQLNDADGKPSDYYAYDLSGMQIELNADSDNWDGGATVTFSDAGDGHNETFPSGNEDSIHWIPSMKHVLGLNLNPTVKTQYVKKEPKPADVLVRMPLRGGHLESLIKPPHWLWQFRTVDGNYKQVQAVADEVHYSFQLKPDHMKFVVYGRTFAPDSTPGAPAPLFTLKTKQSTDKTIDQLYLANIPSGGFFTTTQQKIGYKDPHFIMHYKVIDGAVEYEPVIIGRIDRQDPTPSPLASGVYCGPDTLP